ncbi:MAG: hypothetical protein QXP60_04610 [Nitrososphaerota archaeon]
MISILDALAAFFTTLIFLSFIYPLYYDSSELILLIKSNHAYEIANRILAISYSLGYIEELKEKLACNESLEKILNKIANICPKEYDCEIFVKNFNGEIISKVGLIKKNFAIEQEIILLTNFEKYLLIVKVAC